MPNLSICIITKNECDNLKICLERIKALGCEIVVVDTGSSDNSKKIASAVTPCVYDFVWCDDFSAARNFAIQKAANDWILFLDSDEFVDAFDMPKLLEQLQAMPASIGHIHIKSLYENNGQTMSSTEPIARLFSRKLYHFEGRIHEQIVPLDASTEPDYFDAPVYVTHVGYQGNEAVSYTHLTLPTKRIVYIYVVCVFLKKKKEDMSLIHILRRMNEARTRSK